MTDCKHNILKRMESAIHEANGYQCQDCKQFFAVQLEQGNITVTFGDRYELAAQTLDVAAKMAGK